MLTALVATHFTSTNHSELLWSRVYPKSQGFLNFFKYRSPCKKKDMKHQGNFLQCRKRKRKLKCNDLCGLHGINAMSVCFFVLFSYYTRNLDSHVTYDTHQSYDFVQFHMDIFQQRVEVLQHFNMFGVLLNQIN
jgi:hypothetical protein